MAILKSEVLFTGPLGNISAYTRKGSDKIILRRKGGATRKKIKTAPSFENTRRINAEFGGRSMATKWLMRALQHHRALADHSFTGKVNALLKPIQQLDHDNPWGKRSIFLTLNRGLLEGFSLNVGSTLDSLVRAPMPCAFSRETRAAVLEIPELIPGINFHPSPHHPVYSFVIGAGIVPDLRYDKDGYVTVNETLQEIPAVATESPWHATTSKATPFSLPLIVPGHFILPGTCVVITIGIKFGKVMPDGTTEQIKHAGAAAIRLVL